MQRVPIDLGLLKINGIARGYPYENKWKYTKHQCKSFEFQKARKIHGKLINSDLLKFIEFAMGGGALTKANFDITKLVQHILKCNGNIMEMHGGSTGSELLKFNEIAKGVPLCITIQIIQNCFRGCGAHKRHDPCRQSGN